MSDKQTSTFTKAVEYDLEQIGDPWQKPEDFDFEALAEEKRYSRTWIQILLAKGWIYQGTYEMMKYHFEDSDFPVVGVRRLKPVNLARRVEIRQIDDEYQVWQYDSRNKEEKLLARSIRSEIYAEEIRDFYSDMAEQEQIALERSEGAKNGE